MTTTRMFLQNASTRHAIFVERYAGSQYKEVLPYLERIRKVTLARLSQVTVTELNKKRMKALLSEIDTELEKIYAQMGKKINKNMLEFADYEADFSARMFTKATNTDFTKPAKVAIEASLVSEPLLLSKDKLSIESALLEFSAAKRKRIATIIKDGAVQGRTNEEIVKDLEFVTKKMSQNHARALVTTITNHTSTQARLATISDNEDILDGVEWVSTLDSSTTHTCQALDGKRFKDGEGPRPPLHWGCRSTVIPRVKPQYSIINKIESERPAVGADGVENVKGKVTYNSWLKAQPKKFQVEALGEKRAKLFRSGELNVYNFVDKNYQPLTLEQLRRKEPLAFEKAGLSE